MQWIFNIPYHNDDVLVSYFNKSAVNTVQYTISPKEVINFVVQTYLICFVFCKSHLRYLMFFFLKQITYSFPFFSIKAINLVHEKNTL